MPVPPSEDDDAAVARAASRFRAQGKRLGVAVVLGVAVLYVGASAVQIVSAVFGLDVRPLPAGPPGSSAWTCAEGLLALSKDVSPPKGASPRDWHPPEDVYRACAASPEGLDAWAALLRLEKTAENIPSAGPGELDPLRRDLFAHLPADLR